jgi:hypothetical protein
MSGQSAQPDETAALVEGLAREMEMLRRRIDDVTARAAQVDALPGLSARVDEVTAVVTQLAHRVTATGTTAKTANTGDADGLVPCWLDHPADTSTAAQDAEVLLGELAVWVGRVYLRYLDATNAFPDCWLWHPEVVEELLWLRHAWQAAYAEGAAPSAAGDWHERQRPGVVARISGYAGTCSLEVHHPRPGRPAPVPMATPTADAAAVIAGWWATARSEPAPLPSRAQLSVADAARRERWNRR